MGKLDCIITQNIDRLHHKAGNSAEKIIEIHGTNAYVICLSCRRTYPRDEIQQLLEEKEEVSSKMNLDCIFSLLEKAAGFKDFEQIFAVEFTKHYLKKLSYALSLLDEELSKRRKKALRMVKKSPYKAVNGIW